MKPFDTKHLLVAGTALVSVAAFATGARAADISAASSATWASSAGQTGADVANAAAGDNLDITGDAVDITITNDTSADDGSGDTNTFEVGAITDSSAATDGDLTVTTGTGSDLTVTIGSAVLDGNVAITGDDADDATIAVTVSDDLTVGGTLAVTTDEADSAESVTLNVTDDLAVTGTTTLTASGTSAAATADISVDGDATFTGAVTVTGGGFSGADATLTLSGATNTFTGGLTLTDATGAASLVLDGAVAQTVSGAIAGDGDITITNTHASGVTFTGANTNTGTITVNNDGNDQAVTFTSDVASAVTLGDGTGTDTITATFGGSSATTVSGAITGGATETVALVFTGGSTVTLSGAATSNIDTVTVSGSTTLDSDAAITATTITIASGSTLDQGAGTIAAAIANSGTINQTDTGAVTGNITGTGTLDIDASATYTGDITQSAADVATGVTFTVVGAYDVDTTTLNGAAGTIGFTTGNDVTGNIVAAADGEGVVTFTDTAATTAITGNIGTSSVAVEDLTITDGAAAAVVTTTGDLYVNDIDIGQADTLSFIGTGTQYVSGTIDEASGGSSAITIGDGSSATPTVTFAGIIGGSGNVADLTVNDGAEAVFQADATFDGALSADAATIEVQEGSTLTADTQTDADVTTWDIGVSNTAGGSQTNGTVVFSSDAVNLAVDTVNFVVSATSDALTTGASILDDVFQGNAAVTTTGVTVTDNSYLYAFTLVDDTNNVDVTVSLDNTIAETADNTANENAGDMLLTTLSSSTNTEIGLIQGQLIAAGSAAGVNEVLEATVSDVAGGAVQSGLTIASQSSRITGTRLAALRDGGSAGMSAGDLSDGVQVWGQAFGQMATQDRRDGVAGYDADTYGFVAGIDTEAMAEDLTVGVALSYANTEVDSDASDNAQTETDSYQVTLYGDYDINNRTYVSGQIGYIYGDSATSRDNVGGVSSLDVTGDFDSSVYVAAAELGHDYTVDHNVVVTPKLTLDYAHYDADGYTETGAGGASLSVGDTELDILELGLAVDVATTHSYADGSYIKPKLSLGVRHDVIGDEVETTNQFVGGGSAFKVEGFDPAQTTFDVGLGLSYFTTDNWELTGQYGYEFKEDYDSHTGSLKAAYKF